MKNLSILTSSHEDVMNKGELIENLIQRVSEAVHLQHGEIVIVRDDQGNAIGM
jgi:hypothetical protein